MKNFGFMVLLLASLSACRLFSPEEQTETTGIYYAGDFQRYRENVAVKEATADTVTYEYKDVRVDELAPLAIMHCAENGGKKAYLRHIVLYRNHLRRATFDCLNLAIED